MERLPILSARREEFVHAGCRTKVQVRVSHRNNETSKPAPFKNRRVRHPQKTGVHFSGVEGLATRPTRILGRSRLAAWLNTQALGSNFSKTRMNLLLLGSNNAGSTSAPFAGKKIAKDAAPENSNRGFNELRCGVRGFATRPGGRSFISYQVYSEEGADNVI